jgi:hypothetical protein
MAGVLADAELAAEAAAGLAINIAQDKAAADQEAASIPILYDQLLESALEGGSVLCTPQLGADVGCTFHAHSLHAQQPAAEPHARPWLSHDGAEDRLRNRHTAHGQGASKMAVVQHGRATDRARTPQFIIMNNYLPFAPPQLKDRINPDHWLGFVEELNESGTPNPDCLLACGMYMSCTCCWLGPKIKAEFEQKVDAAIEKHIGFFKPHVKAMNQELERWVSSLGSRFTHYNDCSWSFLKLPNYEEVDLALMPDGVHPKGQGGEALLKCMSRAIESALIAAAVVGS